MSYVVAVVGATGLVGTEIISILEQRKFPISGLRPIASDESVGMTVTFRGQALKVLPLRPDIFDGVDFVLSSAGAAVSRKFAPWAVQRGCIVIDNTREFRMDPEVPLVVPEVNPKQAFQHKGIIANPNCSTIQLVMTLDVLRKTWGLKRVVVSTYQSVGGKGKNAIEELSRQTVALFNQTPFDILNFPHQIAFNLLPKIDKFDEKTGYTLEELKVVNESRKILAMPDLRITCTAVRVPIFSCHAESVNVETEKPFKLDDVRKAISDAAGMELTDQPLEDEYPMPITAAATDQVFVGRIRRDFSLENGLNLWIVADNIRKGAALNAVQIAELLKNAS